jgi:hypothetical protein
MSTLYADQPDMGRSGRRRFSSVCSLSSVGRVEAGQAVVAEEAGTGVSNAPTHTATNASVIDHRVRISVLLFLAKARQAAESLVDDRKNACGVADQWMLPP